MKRYFLIGISIILTLALAMVAYGAWLNYNDEHQIALSMEERTLQITGARAQMQPLNPEVTMDTLRLYSEKMADAVAMTDGRIQKWNVEKNSPVRQGDLLVTMTNEQIPVHIQHASSAVRRAEAALAQALNSYHRQQRLLDRNATSQEKYEESEAQYLAAKEALAGAEAEREQYLIQQDRLNIYSPVDGDVLFIYHKQGTQVQAGASVALVGDFSHLFFNLTLNDEDTRYLSKDTVAILRFEDSSVSQKVYGTRYEAGNQRGRQEVHATLKSILPPLSEPADIRQSVWEIDNRTRLLEPMTYTGVTMLAEKPRECLAIPRLAMLDSKMNTVFVVDDDGILHRREVTAGIGNSQYVEITSGLSEGEIVVVGRTDGLIDGQRVKIVMQEDSGE